LLDGLHAWLTRTLERVSTRSSLANAIGRALARWTALMRYRDDGRIEMRQQRGRARAARHRPWTRKYLFMGSDAGGARAAAVYSPVETAKLNGLDPQACLRDVLERIADHPINRIDEMLPWNFVQAERERRAA
jgi:hypothetical protein